MRQEAILGTDPALAGVAGDPERMLEPLRAPGGSRLGGHLWVIRRVLIALGTLLAVTVLVFAATQIIPGDPARAILGHQATPERIAALNRQLHLDRSAPHQYLSWLGGVLHGDMGQSLAGREPVASLVGDRVLNSTILVAISMVFVLILSIGLGTLCALRRDRLLDNALQGTALALIAMPDFVVGVLLVVLLATSVFHLFPAVTVLAPGQSVVSQPKQLVLPVLTLVLISAPYLLRVVRAAMIDVLESEYVHMARLKGVSETRLLGAHAFPNALIPIVQASAVVTAWLAGGIVVVEFLFNYPGVGAALTNAVANRDVPMIQALVLFLASIYVFVNLIADLVVFYGTPRLRTGGR